MPTSTEWKEIIAPDEGERFARYAEQIGEIQKRRKTPARGFHPKQLAGCKAQLVIRPDLPAELRHGLFAEAKTHDAWVRFSNGSIRVQDDHKGDIRGMVVKVFGVPGKKCIAALGDATTQDLSMIQTQSLVFRDADEFMWFVHAAQKPATLPLRLIGRLGLGRALHVLGKLRAETLKPLATLAGTHFWNPMAVRLGPHAMHYSARPSAVPAPPPPSTSPDYLGQDMAARLRSGPVSYDILIQLFVDDKKTPIEDTSVPWREADAPFVHAATLTLGQQDLDSPEGRALAAKIEAATFNPWHALEEHRPLGNMMRARDPAYVVSTQNRSAVAETEQKSA